MEHSRNVRTFNIRRHPTPKCQSCTMVLLQAKKWRRDISFSSCEAKILIADKILHRSHVVMKFIRSFISLQTVVLEELWRSLGTRYMARNNIRSEPVQASNCLHSFLSGSSGTVRKPNWISTVTHFLTKLYFNFHYACTTICSNNECL
jgi:hypothetical protein